MKWLRGFVLILILFIAILMMAVALVVYFIDPNKFKDTLTTEVSKHSDYDLLIDGNLSWSLYPQLGIKARHIILKNKGEKTIFMEAQGVSLSSHLSTLFKGLEAIKGSVYADHVHIFRLHFNNLHGSFNYEKNNLAIDLQNVWLYEGSMRGVLTIHQLNANPHWASSAQLKRVQLEPLLADLNPQDTKIKVSGVGNVNYDLKSNGETEIELARNLAGNSHFELHHGVVEGVDINYLLKSAEAIVEQQSLPTAPEVQKTNFDSLTGDITFANGKAMTQNTLLLAPNFTVKGQGELTLLPQIVQFYMQVQPKNLSINFNIPMVITGKLDNPSVGLDMNKVNSLLSNEIDELKEKVGGKIQKLVPGKAGQLLQNLLGS